MDLIFLSKQYAEELKSKIINSDDIIFVNIRRELALKVSFIESLETSNLDIYANNILALCNAGYYLNDDSYLKSATKTLDVLIAKPVKDLLSSTDVSSVKKIQALCKLMHSVSMLAQTHDCYEKSMKEWFVSVNQALAEDVIKTPIYDGSLIFLQAYHIAYKTWCNDNQGVLDLIEFYKNDILPQIETYKLKMPNENSLIAMLDILNGMTMVCELAYLNGIDIWKYEIIGADNLRELAIEMMDYVRNPFLWKYPMEDETLPDDVYAFQYLALRLGMNEGLKINENRRVAKYMIRNQDPLGPLVLLPNSPILNNTQLFSKMGFNITGYSHVK